ncbi:ABC transporter, putative [Talaromyces stipitatus ATCC 10500]|uniref:ABC transporter, putative n=1 Tax=Talaromyces stipitatus (strain ATCC 10500 / CBS 375.48 / QM 6759 / NRRL 1006) TaxID=441959 RepID=B8M687_TALSN|nr:ABC transporter, putative [Talaromyces stipitatus ATCC 10500]EED19262.1 ABC transporter, putative [Talaromyces stipitatus ATCC 10500]
MSDNIDSTIDIEGNKTEQGFLLNDTVHSFSWKDLFVTVKDRQTKQMKDLICDVNGSVGKGELMAIMGPSGCGKTTLLNLLARRNPTSSAKISGHTMVGGSDIDNSSFSRISSYVEQEDTLIGALTVEETLKFSAELSLPSSTSKSERNDRVQLLLNAFGIQEQAKTIIGTPIRKGISGGQKRRVSVASQLITSPKILFMDEPTSGLDSTASFEVISYLKKLARRNNLFVIASIHQPSTSTFELFDKLLLLSKGRTCYFGPTAGVGTYFNAIGYPVPLHINPAEFILDIVSTDFSHDDEVGAFGEKANSNRTPTERLKYIHKCWQESEQARTTERQATQSPDGQNSTNMKLLVEDVASSRPAWYRIVLALIHRSFIKSNRDVVAYGIRIAMYLGLAIMMGTVWLRLHTSQEYIQPFINAIFFGSAFMSFMAVAYVPAFLEDRSTFVKERANGLYGATPFIISNFLIGLPYLFLISLLFSIVAYWLSNFEPSAVAFFNWVMWLFLDLVAAESLVVLMSSIFPNFVISLALVAFANGLWMSVGGFLVTPTILNPFWKYVFHYIDYQAYVFQGMMVNEFSRRNYSCGSSCQCMFQTELASQCQIRGSGVLQQYGYAEGRQGKWVGILIAIIAVYRLFGWIALVLKRT